MFIQIENQKINLNAGFCISIAQHFDEHQPEMFGVPLAMALPYQDGTYIGDVKQGSGCNFDTVTITPHCNGTHTESVGHILIDKIPVYPLLTPKFYKAQLLSVQVQKVKTNQETYIPTLQENDIVITKNQLEGKIDLDSEVLMINTGNNPLEKVFQGQNEMPFFTNEAMEYLSQQTHIQHLIVDLPSIDKAHDEGKLSNHHIWWQVNPQSRILQETSRSDRTISEWVFYPTNCNDGKYFVIYQAPLWGLDAVPTSIWLYKRN